MKDSPAVLWAVALVVTALWGFNFVVIAVGLQEMPPLLMVALRFIFASLPAVFFVRRPKAGWGGLIAYGLFLGVGQFGLLFTAISWGAPAGLSSVILQAQAFFTALLAVGFLGEKFRWNHAVGLVTAGAGLVLLGLTKTPAGGFSVPWPALVLLILAALMWASANIVMRKFGPVDAFGVTVWSSLVPPIPLLLLSWWLEGGDRIASSLGHLGWVGIGSVAYLAVLSTLVAYGLWNTLIARRGASAVAPFSLLVPVFGVSSAWLVLGEALTPLHLAAAGLILGGLVVHVFGGRWARRTA